MTVVTRFAPSPTGFLHIGGARTALFNWLYARRHNGSFFLRIEDTDQDRSTEASVKTIYKGLKWLGLYHDGDVVSQSERIERHTEVAQELLKSGKAYRCWCTPDELEQMRIKARSEGRSVRYDRRWRDREPGGEQKNIPPAIRLKMPLTGTTRIHDLVQGTIEFSNDQLDDMILLRSDGTPTYMLSVVVDDHDMQISHIIRGDDHLTNAARQTQIFNSLDWDVPKYAHIPLLHGADGAKLSKRHGALATDYYAEELGILPEAMLNYLLRLGWSHGNKEIISSESAKKWFNLESIGRSSARFDIEKLMSLNAHYIREISIDRLVERLMPHLTAALKRPLADREVNRLRCILPTLTLRVNNLLELSEKSQFLFFERPIYIEDKAKKVITNENLNWISEVVLELENIEIWGLDSLEILIRKFCKRKNIKIGTLAQPLRVLLTGSTVSPGIFDVLFSLGKNEVIQRLKDKH